MATYKTIAEIKKYYDLDIYTSNEDVILTMYNDYIIPITDDGAILCDIGLFYQCELKKHTAAKKYFQMAIDKGFYIAIHNMAWQYQHIEFKYDIMEKLYMISIHEYKNVRSMNNMGVYHNYITKNYDEMKKYYLMAIEYKHLLSMYNLMIYYKEIEKNYDEMKKYNLIAIEHKHLLSMYHLAIYYKDIEDNIPLMLQYFSMAAELKHRASTIRLANYYTSISNIPEMLKYHIMLIEDNDISRISEIVPKHISYTELYTKLVNKKCLMSHLQTTKQTGELVKLITLE